MQTVRPPTTFHHAAGEFVDDRHFVVANDIVFVALENLMRLQRLVGVVDDGDVHRIIEALALQQVRLTQHVFEFLIAFLGQRDRARLFIDLEVFVAELRNKRVERHIKLGLGFRRTRNDQRRTRFIDQD